MNNAPTLEDRIVRGNVSNSAESGGILVFDEDWGEEDFTTCLRRSRAKDEVFQRLNAGWTLTLFRYRSAEGAVILIVLRLDAPDGSEKFVRPLRVQRRIGVRLEVVALGLEPLRPLYGLDRLAAWPDATVLLAEGEKAAEAGQRRFPELVVMSWSNGASGVAKADWRPLSGRDTIIWPDNDSAGRSAARAIAKTLARIKAASIKIVENPDWFPDKWDLANLVPRAAHG